MFIITLLFCVLHKYMACPKISLLSSSFLSQYPVPQHFGLKPQYPLMLDSAITLNLA